MVYERECGVIVMLSAPVKEEQVYIKPVPVFSFLAYCFLLSMNSCVPSIGVRREMVRSDSLLNSLFILQNASR